MPFVVISILSTLIVLGIMVLVHEFGHFAVAKLFRVKVEVFSIGFGKRLFGFRRGDTDYRLSLLPLGGYVKMQGELGGDGTVPLETTVLSGTAASGDAPRDSGDLNSKPRWQRVLIALAGPVANFILALVLMTGLYMMHNEVDAYRSKPADIDFVAQNTPASDAGIQSGDRIVRFDNRSNPTWDTLWMRTEPNLGQKVAVTVLRKGQRVDTTLSVPAPRDADSFSIGSLGFVPLMQTTPIVVHGIEPSMPAGKAGLKAGDKILAIDGQALHSAPAILAYLQQMRGAPVTVKVQSGNTVHDLQVTPRIADTGEGKVYQLGFETEPPPFKVEELPLPAAMIQSAKFNVKNSSLIIEVLRRMVTRHMAVQNLSGPIGIARETGLAATSPGWQPIIALMTVISLNLGIFNLLPVPILDGGVILLLLIESVLRHDLDQKFKERIYQGAFVLLLLFAAFVMINDITKLPILSKVKP
jgi:regulator of sigma E protease